MSGDADPVGTIGVMGTAAVTEEVVFGGIIFRIAEQRLGSWLALVISTVLFGLIRVGVHFAWNVVEPGFGTAVWL